MGEWMLSVRVMTFAFRLLANSSAFRVRMEYLGKLMPMMTSFSLKPGSLASLALLPHLWSPRGDQ